MNPKSIIINKNKWRDDTKQEVWEQITYTQSPDLW